MRLTRLAIVCFEDPRHVTGGVQRRIASEIEYFAHGGVQVTVVCEGPIGRSVAGNVTYITVPTPSVIYPVRTLFFSARASRVLRELPPFDVIETHHDGGAAVLLAFPLGMRKRTAHVEVVHGVFRDEFASIRRYEKGLKAVLPALGLLPLSLIERRAARRAGAVLAVSEYAAAKIVSYYGVPRERIHVVPNGIDMGRYSPEPGKTTTSSAQCSVLFVGRWHSRKGVLQLIEAFAMAHAANKDLRLKMIGRGLLEAAMRERTEQLGLTGVVEFLGPLDDDAVLKAYRAADIVCVPSLQEGQGIVALEAQACGTPIVATLAGGLAEAVRDGHTGLLVPVGDALALSQALTLLAGNPALRQEYGRNAVQWAGSFKWEILLAKQDTLYSSLHTDAWHVAGALRSELR